jgi:O-succinylbenzoate synthase
VRIDTVELRRITLPLVAPFRTAFATLTERDVLLVRVVADGVEGWGECVAFPDPGYSPEYVDGAQTVLREFLVPRVLAAPRVTAAGLGGLLAPVVGHPMAKAALELAVLDAELRTEGRSLAARLGASRAAVDCGVSVGMFPLDELRDQVDRYVAAGYRRVKLKIEPGFDVEPVRAVREAHPDLALQVDANASYTVADADRLAALDPFGLLLIEQPLAEDDLLGHAELARRVTTPICLDESITSARVAETALALGACRIVNVKAGRVGGYLEAVRVHDVCTARSVPVWCGGMLETGIGRAANVALAALPGFTLPGDTSASDRYYARDVVTDPFVLDDGRLAVPTGPGTGVTIDRDALDTATTAVETLRR